MSLSFFVSMKGMSTSQDTGACEQVVNLKGAVSLDVVWDVCLLGLSVPNW